MSSAQQNKGGCCPFNKTGENTITPVILASHVGVVNLVILVLKWLNMSFLSLSLNFIMLSLLACLVTVQAKKLLNIELKSESSVKPACPTFFSCCNFDLNNQESIENLYRKLYDVINNSIQAFRKVVLLHDKLYTIKVIVSLYALTKIAQWFGDFGLLALAANVVCIAPYVIQNHSEQIASVAKLVEQKARETLEPLLAKAGLKQKTE